MEEFVPTRTNEYIIYSASSTKTEIWSAGIDPKERDLHPPEKVLMSAPKMTIGTEETDTLSKASRANMYAGSFFDGMSAIAIGGRIFMFHPDVNYRRLLGTAVRDGRGFAALSETNGWDVNNGLADMEAEVNAHIRAFAMLVYLNGFDKQRVIIDDPGNRYECSVLYGRPNYYFPRADGITLRHNNPFGRDISHDLYETFSFHRGSYRASRMFRAGA